MSATELRWQGVAAAGLLVVLFTRVSDLPWLDSLPVSLTQAVVVLFAVVVVVERCVRRRPGGPAWHPLLTWMLVYAAAICVSAILATDRLVSAAALVAYLRDTVIVWILLNLVTTIADLRRALWSLVGAGCFLALAAVLHALTGFDMGGLSTLAVQIGGSGDMAVRLEGPIGVDSNVFAQLLVVVAPLALYLAWTERHPVARWVALGALVLLCVSVMWTFSRGGLVGLVLVLASATALQRTNPRRLAAPALVAAAIAVGTPHLYWSRVGLTFGDAAMVAAGNVPTPVAPRSPTPAAPAPAGRSGSDLIAAAMSVSASTAPPAAPTASDQASPIPARSRTDDSVFDRSSLMRVGTQIFVDHPLTGIGKGNYLSVYPSYARRVDPGLPSVPMGPHNTLIHIAAESGLVGIAAFIGLIATAGLTIRAARRRLVRRCLEREAMLLEAVGLAIAGYLITSMFLNDTIYVRSLWLLLALAAAGSLSAHRVAPAPADDG